MKNDFIAPVFAVLISMMMLSCEKESLDPSETSYDGANRGKTETELPQDKSGATDFEKLSQAAGLNAITYENNQYKCTFYGTSNAYYVSVLNFDDEDEIAFEIALGSTTTDVEIDVVGRVIYIQNQGNTSFDDFENETIRSSTDKFRALAAIITLHHLINPMGAISFGDNGDGDVYPEPQYASCFWCNEITYGPCQGGLFRWRFTQRVRFWSDWGDPQMTEVPC